MKRKALGKGLGSLIPTSLPRPAVASAPGPSHPPVSETRIEISKIRPNPRQPRQSFDEEALNGLAESMKTQGVLQPVVLRPVRDGHYELIAGERRWRAAQRAGIHRIPAIIRDVPDEQLLELALIENIQREELNAIDEAEAYRILVDDLVLTQNEVAERVGKQRTTVANALRLLNLPRPVQNMVRERRISMGHARALLALEDAKAIEALAEQIIAEGLSVRVVESRAKRPSSAGRPGRPTTATDPNVAAAEASLQRALGTKVRITGNGKRGRIEIHYHNAEQLEGIFQVLGESRRQPA